MSEGSEEREFSQRSESDEPVAAQPFATRVGAGISAPLPEVVGALPHLGGSDVSSRLVATLAGRGIHTLSDVQRAGGLGDLSTLPPDTLAAARMLAAQADLVRLSPDLHANATLINRGFSSALAIADAPRSEFVAAAHDILGDFGAAQMHVAARAQVSVLNNLLAGIAADGLMPGADGHAGQQTPMHVLASTMHTSCDCSDCQATSSPAAYLADLIGYVVKHVRVKTATVNLDYLQDALFQPLGDLATDCQAVEKLVRQVRICSEVLREYLKAAPPTAGRQAGLDKAEAAYRVSAYTTLLDRLGASYEDVRLARHAPPAERAELAARLAIDVDPTLFSRPDRLDALFLDPGATPPAVEAITEVGLERLVGLTATTLDRNPLSDGPTFGDSQNQLTRWSLDGVEWGRNTDVDGLVYVSLTHPAGSFQVDLHRDIGRAELVASGWSSSATATVTLAEKNHSGLTGRLSLAYKADASDISLSAIPKLLAWRFDHLRPFWMAQDRPDDAYTAGQVSAPLDALPAGLVFPTTLAVGISHDAAGAILVADGVISETDRVILLGLSGNAAYQSAVNRLYVDALRPPSIEPDVVGPDDFRLPFPKAAPGDPDGPFDLWLRRRAWVDGRLAAFAAITKVVGGRTVPDLDAMLVAMTTSVTYDATTVTAWDTTTTLAVLPDLRDNLATGTDLAATRLRIAADLGLPADAFTRLMDLRLKDAAAQVDPRERPLADAEWREVFSILTQAQKRRLFAAWRDEESSVGVQLGPRDFWPSQREPGQGDWPPVPTPGRPLVDPEVQKVQDLPERTAGTRALAFLEARQVELAAAHTNLWTTRQSVGPAAMLRQALGSPNRGDPLPFNLAALAADLQSPLAAVRDAATTQVTQALHLSLDNFGALMAVLAKDADPDPLKKPSTDDWAEVTGFLTTADKELHLFPAWIAQEQSPATGLVDWSALKIKLPPWRAPGEARPAWQTALRTRSAPGVIDPDLIGPSELRTPLAGDRAFDLWSARRAWVDGEMATLQSTVTAAATPLAGFDTILATTAGVQGQELFDLDTARLSGDDVEPRLGQLGLSLEGFDLLVRFRKLAQATVPILASEWDDLVALLVQVEKLRRSATWRQEEAQAGTGPGLLRGIVVGPDDFRLPEVAIGPLAAPPPALPRWLASGEARDAWLGTLRGRIDQQNSTMMGMRQAVDVAEEAALPALRDALVQATAAPGADLPARARWVTSRLQIDASMGGCQKTTRVEQALETLQGLVWAIRAGQLAAWPAQIWLDAPDFDLEWKWMSSYAPWRAAMLVTLRPENVLAPSLRKWQSSAFANLVDNLRWSTSLTTDMACQQASTYAAYFHDVCTLTIQATCQTDTHLYRQVDGGCPVDAGKRSLLYLFAHAENSGTCYWATFDQTVDSGYAQTFWEPIPKLDRRDQIVGAAVYNHQIYVFATHFEDAGPVLHYVRYDCEARRWVGDVTPLPLPKAPTRTWTFLVKQTASEQNPPHLLLDLDHALYEKRLNYAGTGWADNNWIGFYLDRWSDVNISGASRDHATDSAEVAGLRWPVTVVGMVGEPDPDIFFVFGVDADGFLWCFYRRMSIPEKAPLHGPTPSQYGWRRLDKAAYLGAFFSPDKSQAYLATSATPLWLIWEEDAPGSVGVVQAIPAGPFISGLQWVVPIGGLVPDAFTKHERLFAYRLSDGSYHGLLHRNGSGLKESGRSRAVPVATGPFEITQAGTAADQNNRATLIKAAFAANAGASRSIIAYLEEATYLVQMQIGLAFQLSHQYEVALSWFRTAYDYTLPLADRKVSYGLVLEASLPAGVARLGDWLLDPLNPHLIAATRRNAYTRYTLLTLVRCFYDYADAEFTRDTAESNAHARLLYSIGLDFLDLAELAPATDPCDGLWIKLGEDVVVDDWWFGVWDRVKWTINQLSDARVMEQVIPKVKAALALDLPWASRFERAMSLVADARAQVTPRPTVKGVVQAQADFLARAYPALLTDPDVSRAADTARQASSRDFVQSMAAATNQTTTALETEPLALPWLRTSVSAPAPPPASGRPLPVRTSDLQLTISGRDFVGELDRRKLWFHVIPAPADWFCTPPNPVLNALRLHGELNLFKLRHCMNIAGMHRDLEPYSAPTDSTSGLPSIGAGGQLLVPGAPGQRGGIGLRPTAYRSSVLMDRAKQLVQLAAQAEDHLLPALEKRDVELYTLLKARQDVRMAQATVQLQDLRVQEADVGVALAQLQQDRAQIQADHWRTMLSQPISNLEQQSLDLMTAEATTQFGAFAANSAAAGASAASISGLLSSESDALGKTGAALASLASVFGTQANQFAARASYERRQQDWRFQQSLAEQDISIGQQGVALAQAHGKVVGQERVIAQIQADHASAVVDFLSNKFTSVDLYDWMSSVLERVYRFFLQQATATALLIPVQLGFERQEVPPAVIQSDYWADPRQQGSNSTMNRHGLTGSARLLQDLYALDQYAFETDKRKLQLSRTISLMELDPYEFQRFRETGVMHFATPLELFDRDFPGQYLRLIRRVRTTVIALIPPAQGIRATLACTGTSRTVIGGDVFQQVVVRRDPQLVALTSPANASGVFDLDTQPNMLLPFEGLGVQSQWEFRMPRASNPIDFSAIADVQMTLEYTALHNFEYSQTVMAQLGRTISANRAFSFRHELADAWYDLHNPNLSASPLVVRFSVGAQDFPANLDDLRIQHLALYVARADGKQFEVSAGLRLARPGTPGVVGGTATTADGMINTRNGNGGPWTGILGASPHGVWELAFPNTAQTRKRFGIGGSDDIDDILFVVTYTGRTPEWPA